MHTVQLSVFDHNDPEAPEKGVIYITPDIAARITADASARVEALAKRLEALEHHTHLICTSDDSGDEDAWHQTNEPMITGGGSAAGIDPCPAKPVDAGPGCYMCGEPRSAHTPEPGGLHVWGKCPAKAVHPTPVESDRQPSREDDTILDELGLAISALGALNSAYNKQGAAEAWQSVADLLSDKNNQIAALRAENENLKAVFETSKGEVARQFERLGRRGRGRER